MWFLWVLFAILTFVLGYILRDDIRKLLSEIKQKKKAGARGSTKRLPPKPRPSGDDGMCFFENQDIILKNVYGYDGARVTDNSGLLCSNCNQYVFRDEDGCVPYGYKGDRVCTIGGYTAGVKKVCASDKDCVTAGAVCRSGQCYNWEIPDSKVCPW